MKKIKEKIYLKRIEDIGCMIYFEQGWKKVNFTHSSGDSRTMNKNFINIIE